FVRVLVRADGEPIRELTDGEKVRMSGCHVRIKPKDKEKIGVWLRILGLRKEGWGYKRIANLLTEEGIPSPDAGRARKDNGVSHVIQGPWPHNTIKSLCENEAIIGNLVWGIRSEGTHRRIGADGPRLLDAADRNVENLAKIVVNQKELHVRASAGYTALYDPGEFATIQELNAQRGQNQRGQTRSTDPYRYVLACRVNDMACGYPMYGMARGGKQKYVCGLYHKHAGSCDHNTVAADDLLRVVLRKLLSAMRREGRLEDLRRELLNLATAESAPNKAGEDKERVRAEIKALEQQRDAATRNMTLAEDAEVSAAMQQEFKRINAQLAAKERELAELRSREPKPATSVGEQVEAAMALLGDMERLVEVAKGPELMRLFDVLNLQVWLKFDKALCGNRKLNKLTHGVLTTGDAPWPIEKYKGLRGVPSGTSKADTGKKQPGGSSDPPGSTSCNKVHRGDWTRTSDLLLPKQFFSFVASGFFLTTSCSMGTCYRDSPVAYRFDRKCPPGQNVSPVLGQMCPLLLACLLPTE
ncbi:MAG: recombinase family protein, partial [Planctomycetota bacterium]|nr:recombinase family protein [Planctomycetota bacterium]